MMDEAWWMMNYIYIVVMVEEDDDGGGGGGLEEETRGDFYFHRRAGMNETFTFLLQLPWTPFPAAQEYCSDAWLMIYQYFDIVALE